MSILYASNSKADFGGPPATNATGTYNDATRTPYAIYVPYNAATSFVGNHPAPVATITWYHYRMAVASSFANYTIKIFTVRDVAGNELALIKVYNSFMQASANGDTVVVGVSGGPALLAGATIMVDVKITVTTTDVSIGVYANSALVTSATAANTGGKGVASSFGFMNIGGWDYYVSEVIIADADTRGLRLTRLNPTAVGNYTQWAGGFSELGDDSLTTAAVSGTVGNRVSSVLATYSGSDVISSVVASIRGSLSVGAVGGVSNSLRIGTTDYDGVVIPLAPASAPYATEWTADPSDSAAWTAAKVNATQLGLLATA